MSANFNMSAPQLDKISGLPGEVLLAIIENVHHSQTLSSLCRVSRLFNRLTTPKLYQATILHCCPGLKPDHSPFKRFSKIWPHIELGSSIRYIHDLKFKNDSCDAQFICWHALNNPNNVGLEYMPEASEKQKMERIYDQHFPAFFQRLRTNGLRSFCWELGSCVPSNILGPGGYLPKFQTRLEQLALTTKPDCYTHETQDEMYDLSAFRNLRMFSWTGPQTLGDYISLDKCLRLNFRHLESLTLEMTDQEILTRLTLDDLKVFDITDPDCNFFVEAILRITAEDMPSDPVFRLLALEKLSLTEVHLSPYTERISESLSLSQLKCLKLRHCPWTDCLLEHLTESKICLNLRSLEISYGLHMEDVWEFHQTVPQFLETLSSLEEVFLCFPASGCTAITNSICDHLPTLQRFAIHERDFNVELDEPEDGMNWYNDGLERLLAANQCDFVGVSIDMDILRNKLNRHASIVSCKILHVRAAADQIVLGMNRLDGFAN